MLREQIGDGYGGDGDLLNPLLIFLDPIFQMINKMGLVETRYTLGPVSYGCVRCDSEQGMNAILRCLGGAFKSQLGLRHIIFPQFIKNVGQWFNKQPRQVMFTD